MLEEGDLSPSPSFFLSIMDASRFSIALRFHDDHVHEKRRKSPTLPSTSASPGPSSIHALKEESRNEGRDQKVPEPPSPPPPPPPDQETTHPIDLYGTSPPFMMPTASKLSLLGTWHHQAGSSEDRDQGTH